MSGQTILITGANRGIGLALTEQFLEKDCGIIATYRDADRSARLLQLAKEHSERLRLETLDVEDRASIEALAERLAEGGVKLNVLINNAGYLDRSAETLETLNYERAERTLRVNALAPLYLLHCLLPLMNTNDLAKLVTISSVMGSLAESDEPGWYAYRMSKAAVNMLTVNLAPALKEKNIVLVSVHPGWVKTDMGGPQARENVKDSAAGIAKVIDGLTLQDSGRFFRFTGEPLPY